MKKRICRVWQKVCDCSKSNQGFTMVELLVALMIFGFFAAALFTFMISTAQVSSKVNSSTNLSVQSQVALGLIEEYLVDCSGMVEFDDTTETLYIVNNESYGDSTDAAVYIYQYYRDKKSLYYNYVTADREFVRVGDTGVDGEICTLDAWIFTAGSINHNNWELVSKNVDDFLVEFTTEEVQITVDDAIERVTTVDITLEMSLESGSETYNGSSVMLLRNLPTVNVLLNKPDLSDFVGDTVT